MQSEHTELRSLGAVTSVRTKFFKRPNIIQITLRFYAKIFNRDFKRHLRRRAQPRITHTFTRTLAELLERRADLGFFWDISGAGWGPGKTARD